MHIVHLTQGTRGVLPSLCSPVPQVHHPSHLGAPLPPPLPLPRRHVSPNLPLVVRGGCAHWPAAASWSPAALRAALPATQVTVAVTPTGLADAAVGEQFVMPEERRMTMAAFLDQLEEPVEGEVYYVQRQNSNLTEELGELLGDVAELPWASEAFDRPPDATNFWMGDERAVTSSKSLLPLSSNPPPSAQGPV